MTGCMSTYHQMFFLDKDLKNAMRVVDTLHNREVILLGMPHLGTEKGYAALRSYILERSAEGYVFFIEGVAHHDPYYDGEYDSLKQDTLERKLRFVTGFAFTPYGDKDNKSLPEMYKNTKHNAIDPTAELLGFDKINGVYPMDLTMAQMINFFEAKFGEIPLTQYDFNTPLNAKYTKTKDYPYDIYAIASPIREMYVVDNVVHSELPKIIIMYGTAHLHHLAYKLEAVGYNELQRHYLQKEKSKTDKNKPSKTK